jgi:hypothetical protein
MQIFWVGITVVCEPEILYNDSSLKICNSCLSNFLNGKHHHFHYMEFMFNFQFSDDN